MSDRHLLKELTLAILIKLFLLTALWWMFVCDERPRVDAERVAQAMFAAPESALEKPGETIVVAVALL